MTGFGSPCGACKCLRRKCVRGCLFVPYFCHEEGAANFAAIQKVFGASNVSKLLAHLPVSDRAEAVVSISYEALARVQDPIYGCVSHIFELQQQVVSLQAQLASLRAEAAHHTGNGCSTSSSSDEKKLYRDFHTLASPEVQGYFHSVGSRTRNTNCYGESSDHDIELMDPNPSFDCQHIGMYGESSSYSALKDLSIASEGFQGTEDLESVAFPYLRQY